MRYMTGLQEDVIGVGPPVPPDMAADYSAPIPISYERWKALYGAGMSDRQAAGKYADLVSRGILFQPPSSSALPKWALPVGLAVGALALIVGMRKS